MKDALEDHEGTVSIGGTTITNLRFADDTNGLAGEEGELARLAESLDRASAAYSLRQDVKSQLLTNVFCHRLGGILMSILSYVVPVCLILVSRNFQLATCLLSSFTSRPAVWNERSISLSSKIRLIRSLATSIVLYACESSILTAELQRRIRVKEMRCYRKILYISYTDNVTNEEVCAKTIVKRRELKWRGHVSRSSGPAKTILQGTVKGEEHKADQKKRREDNIEQWTGLDPIKSQRAVENREKWTKLVVKSSVVPQRPPRSRDR